MALQSTNRISNTSLEYHNYSLLLNTFLLLSHPAALLGSANTQAQATTSTKQVVCRGLDLWSPGHWEVVHPRPRLQEVAQAPERPYFLLKDNPANSGPPTQTLAVSHKSPGAAPQARLPSELVGPHRASNTGNLVQNIIPLLDLNHWLVS